MTIVDTCPHCGLSQQGDEIPEARRGADGADHLSLTVDVRIGAIYDGTLFYACSLCGGTWHRFLEDNPLHLLAERNMPVPGC
jgi:hypothetical protein